ncbi:hypothetical protein [Spirobacillus cienkowskii]|jgi:predicted PurR-regulated permease PerM|uniref:Uncharacterized protein n=1 Tax=Spirobacillus cienkowskii TaxID=495820 RepID=A0A369KTX6_9BACT|nr:MAG: hypothetical protein DCC88_06640 [Spirobacillus cienkowskii]
MLKYTKGIPFIHSAGHDSSSQEDEPDRPPVLVTSIIVLLSFAFLLVVAAITYTLLWKTSSSLSDAMNTGMGNETRLNYVQSQNELLNTYKKLDNGLYQIPINQSIEIILKENADH